MCVSVDGYLYSFGHNYFGQLGFGNTTTSYFPKRVESLENIDFIECGYKNSICKTLNNQIYCWGDNTYGQLGVGDILDSFIQNTPLVSTNWPNDIVDMKCGAYHTLVLTFNGDVYSCGINENGELGRETEDDLSFNLGKIDFESTITRLECGEYYSKCIDINHNLFVFGDNEYGQLGLGDTNNRNKPIKHPSLSNIIDISSGGNNSFVKTSNNEIYAFGYNEYSQLGIKTEDENQLTPIRVFEDNEDIWFSNINKSKAKSARSILPRPSNEEDNSPPKKVQKTK